MKATITLTLMGSMLLSHPTFANDYAWEQLTIMTDPAKGIGARKAGSVEEKKTAEWIAAEWTKQGYQPEMLTFDFELDKQKLQSQNVQITIQGESDKVLLIGAHYDTKGEDKGSLGATDNGSGVVALLAVSKALEGKTLPYTLKLVAFGAEEYGLNGSKAYIQDKSATANLIGMINLDTIIGGDILYVHSAHSEPYKCDYAPEINYNASTKVRSALKAVSDKLYGENAHILHPTVKGYPEGETGGWSDHAPFACIGVPIAQFEATNFMINGENGNDGYSQTTHKDLWTCFDSKTIGACDSEKEQDWGKIWHTRFDRLDELTPRFGDKLKKQLDQNIQVLISFAEQANNWM
ncbi:peptidase M28 [Grimontia sp. AD028]|uniref:M28 family metallopeptidase n=1 Tax=Grimontia sp. AD028 TaxID=1581149 RepID=UPI00061AF031|nr:M28 family metallopeptidase [Grimontia sp. AD028]KKD58661.1 peptidase M28 [Grimontia sp. AD028]